MRHQSIILTALFVALVVAGPAFAEQVTPRERLIIALEYEWGVANCPSGSVPSLAALQNSMIISGYDPQRDVEKTRSLVHARLKANYVRAIDACAALSKAYEAR